MANCMPKHLRPSQPASMPLTVRSASAQTNERKENMCLRAPLIPSRQRHTVRPAQTVANGVE